MWLWEEKNVRQKLPKKKKKRRKGQNKLVYTEVEGEMGFKQMFTHVLGFSNHKHIAWVFVQENKQSLHRCPLEKHPRRAGVPFWGLRWGPTTVDTAKGGGSEVGNQLGRKLSKKITLDQNLNK